MTYSDYLTAARACASDTEVDELLKIAADDESISDRRYYHIRHVAIESAYEANI